MRNDFHVLQLILLMLRGRHRGLPAAIDRSVHLVHLITSGLNRPSASATMLPVEYLRLNTDDREKAEEARFEDVRRMNEVRDERR